MKRNNNLNFNRRTKGFTLIEMMLVIAVAVGLIGIGLVVYRTVQSSSAGLASSSGLLQLSAATKQLHPNPNYTGVSAQVLIDTKKAPANMISGATLVNGWGGQVTLAPADYNGGTDNAFDVTFDGVPTDACNDMVAAARNNYVKIAVGAGAGTVVKDDSAGVNQTVAQVATACGASASNRITFTTT